MRFDFFKSLSKTQLAGKGRVLLPQIHFELHRFLEDALSQSRDREDPFSPVAALGGRILQRRSHKTLGFEAVERGVDRPDRNLPACTLLKGFGDAKRIS